MDQDPRITARAAREGLVRGLQLLQNPKLPPEFLAAAEPIARAMGALLQIERSDGRTASVHEGADRALLALREALSRVQSLATASTDAEQAMAAVAGSLSMVHSLWRHTSVAPPPPAHPQAQAQAQAQAGARAQQPASYTAAMAPQPAYPPNPHAGAPAHPAPQRQYPVPNPAPQAPQASAFGPVHGSPGPHGAQAGPPPHAFAPPPAQGFAPPPPVYAAPPQPAPITPSTGQAPGTFPAQGQPPIARAPGVPDFNAPPPPAAPSAHGKPAAYNPKLTPSGSSYPPPGTIEAELGAHSQSNFYKTLSGHDIVDHGGIFVATYNVPRMNERIMLRVHLPGGYHFDCHALVRWTRDARDNPDSPPGFGAQLQGIGSEQRQLIMRYARNREPLFYDDL